MWAADNYFNTGNQWVATGTVTGMVDDEMYLSERWDSNSGPELKYDIPVIPAGQYEVTLYFSENYVEDIGD